jgi:hypothetical protein
MMEAALLAVSGYKDKVDYRHYHAYFQDDGRLVNAVGLKPEVQDVKLIQWMRRPGRGKDGIDDPSTMKA